MDSSPGGGGTVVIVIDTNPPTFNSAITTSLSDQQVAVAILSSLIWLDDKGKPQPYLAESWTISQDGRTYTFRLRRNVRWHDGKPFTAEDVKFSIEEVLAKYHPRSSAVFKNVEKLETPDPYTVVIRLKQAFAPFLTVLNPTDAAILPKHLYQGTDILKNPYNLQPVGTGPFKFQEFVRGDRVVVVRNPDYFEPSLPYVDRIIFKIIPDVNSRSVALQTGEVDYIFDSFLAKEDLPWLRQVKGVTIKLDTDFPVDDMFIMNVRSGPLANPQVRQAIAHALDRSRIVERVFQGLGSPGRTPIDSRFTWAYNPEADFRRLYPYNPAIAQRLLDQAGFPLKDGIRFKIRHVFDIRRPGQLPLAQVIKEQLRKVGIDVVLDGVERSVMLDKIYDKWDFDTTSQLYNSNGDPAIGLQRLYICSEIRKAPFVNASGYCNKEVDALFERGATAVTQEDRGAAYKKVQVILARDVPTYVLNERRRVDAARDRVKDLWKSIIGYTYLASIWLAGD